MPFYFTLEKGDFSRLDWGHGTPPELTNEQATIIAIASIASALDSVALQLHQAVGPLQEIADHLKKNERAPQLEASS
jgi:hypothetical protein